MPHPHHHGAGTPDRGSDDRLAGGGKDLRHSRRGHLLVTAIQSNDYNVVIGLSFIYSAMYIGIMLVVDLLYGIIDPRIRLAKGDD